MNESKSLTLRKKMIEEQLRNRGITDETVLSGFLKIKREDFIEPFYHDIAYEDYPIKIGYGQTISQPFIVAYMLQKLTLSKKDKVLEIGTGSGYVTLLLSFLVNHVFTIERIEILLEQAKKVLKQYSSDNITFILRDGFQGFEEQAPYDKIIVSAASRKIPKALFDQLAEGGKMIIPIGDSYEQDLILIQKINGKIKETLLCGCRFVAMKEHVIMITEEKDE